MVGPAYTTRSLAVAADRLINLMPELLEFPRPGSIEVAALYPTPGAEVFTALGSPIRGMKTAASGRCFVVSGNGLYELFDGGGRTLHGTLDTSTGRVGMAENGTQLLVVDGPNGRILTMATNAFPPIVDDGFLGGTHAAFVDGYFCVNVPGTGQWQVSALYDGLSWDASDIVTAEASPDPIVALAEFRREIWTIGSRSTEVWFNQGGADFPFVRIPGAIHQEGTIAPDSVARLGNEGLAWLGQSEHGYGIVWRTNGYQLQRISTHAIEFAIKQAPHPEQATGWSYQVEGHVYYLLTIGGKTWGYDVNTGLWHERALLTSAGTLAPLTVQHHCTAFGKNLVGGSDGTVYALNEGVYTWAGTTMPRIRTWQPVASGDRRRMFHHELEILMETGIGLDGGVQGSDPQIMLRYSDDQAKTWSNERWKRIGAQGEYGISVTWNRLGQSTERIYECMVSDPVKTVFTGANLRATGASE